MDKTLLYLGTATLAGYVFFTLYKPSVVVSGLESTFDMFVQALPWIVVSMFGAGLAAQVISPQMIARWFGPETGVGGIFLAACLGALGTGSRWAVYPLAAGLLATNATPGAVFAFMTTWQLVSLPRLPAELPFLGAKFTIYRFFVSIVIAFIGGLILNAFWSKLPSDPA